jgi:hypothetical protein
LLLESLDAAGKIGAQPRDVLLDLALAVALLLGLTGENAQLDLDRIDPIDEILQRIAAQARRGRDRPGRANLGIDLRAVGKNAPLHRAQLPLDAIDAPLDRLARLRQCRRGQAGGEDE